MRPGGMLLSKVDSGLGPPVGFGLELGETAGLGINLADLGGVSVHQELGRSSLTDGGWRHACMVLQRKPRAQLAVYIDGVHSERLSLQGSRMQRLRSLDNGRPLFIGRRSLEEPGLSPDGAFGELALWSRALLPEHVQQLFREGLPLESADRLRSQMLRNSLSNTSSSSQPGRTWRDALGLTCTLMVLLCLMNRRTAASRDTGATSGYESGDAGL